MSISFADFAASGRDVADLGVEIEGMDLEGVPGRIYAHPGGPFIQREGDGWFLILGNEDFSGDLADLEARLFEWAQSEGIV
ncbi:MAG: hypothetical protein Tp170SUR191951_12 [Prokaryotic dsDNA virus sp.]|nr:hypothetical protein [Pseudomonas sp.]MBS67318.1 hypothetical protein [Pseudomonas sp.]QDP55174.1 MAG: hypothetical protein Tp170SUR191951_12 [Prokaryotic dsDNA virus sp.]|tara:strand:+ start:3701 stop:3943 length:243 start_codon:yes stop_codon:yes gene_type:complete